MKKLIFQGAEAKIFLDNNKIIKERVSKGYRIKELDERLRKQRTKREANLLKKAEEVINVPKVLKQDYFSLEIEYINGERLSETLNNHNKKEQIKIIKQIGEQIGKIHDQNIIHGDLTTSNTILVYNKDKASNKRSLLTNKKGDASQLDNNAEQQSNFKVYFIDFGLGFVSLRVEDKAVDLHLIKQALEAKHFQNSNLLFKGLLKAYKPQAKAKILEQLKKVESRGRYKH
jgi:TP53 regulating kinase-like protein